MLNAIINFSIRNKLIILLFTIAIIVFGLFSLTQISVGAVPDITNNQVQVITTSENLSTVDMEQFITYPVELEMANLPGVKEIRSVSKFGLSVVTVVFEDAMGTYLPRQLLAEKIKSASEQIPASFGTPQMGPITTGLGEIYQYVLDVKPGYEERYSATELRTIQDWIVKRQLSGIPGVVEINSWGGYLKQYEVALNTQKLHAMNIAASEVFAALEKNNSVAGGGYIEKSNQSYFIRGEGLATSLEDIEQMVVANHNGIPVYIKDVANVDNRVDARSVGFALGPRLNAAGRLGKADSGFHLLTSVDLKEAKELALKLDAINQERKNIQEQVQDEVDYLIGREVDLEKDRVIVLASEIFHSGVIGIVASRIVEKYFRPVILIALENGIGKGSGRSIPHFNLHRAFTECASHLVQFGGHAYAAGLTINENSLDSFRSAINEVGRRILSDENLVPELFLDGFLKISEINVTLHEQIALLEPFGAENPPPVFLVQGVSVYELKRMGREESHVRFQAVQGDARIDAVGFNLAKEFSSIAEKSDKVDLACEFQVNDWGGRNKLELKVLDLRYSVEK